MYLVKLTRSQDTDEPDKNEVRDLGPINGRFRFPRPSILTPPKRQLFSQLPQTEEEYEAFQLDKRRIPTVEDIQNGLKSK